MTTTNEDSTMEPQTKQPIQLYANSAEVEATVYDLAIKFGTFQASGERSVDAVIRMSPQHAQSLVYLLERFVNLYKQEVGDFRLPDEHVESLKGGNK